MEGGEDFDVENSDSDDEADSREGDFSPRIYFVMPEIVEADNDKTTADSAH